MINLRKGNTVTVYFTGTENATITDPYFLFVFTNRVTQETVKVMATNTSTTERYDKFSLVVNTYFSTATNGSWEYEIRQKAAVDDLAVSGTIVEIGRMYLKPATDFAPTEYSDNTNTVKTYE